MAVFSKIFSRQWLARILDAMGLQALEKRCMAKETNMFGYSLLFLVVAILAAIFGFGGIAGVATLLAKALFFVFLILFILSVVGEKGEG